MIEELGDQGVQLARLGPPRPVFPPDDDGAGPGREVGLRQRHQLSPRAKHGVGRLGSLLWCSRRHRSNDLRTQVFGS